MKFRTPELFLGALLTFAVFSVGLVSSSRYLVQTTQKTSAEKTAQTKTNKSESKGFWETLATDPVSAFTLCLVLVGAVQAYLFLKQLKIINDSLIHSKAAADAAAESA